MKFPQMPTWMRLSWRQQFMFVSVILVFLVGSTVAMRVRHAREEARWRTFQVKAERHEAFCRYTRQSIAHDASIFEGDSSDLHEQARARFYNGDSIYHNYASVAACLGDDAVPEAPDGACFWRGDWDCLAPFARRLERALVKEGY